MLARFDDHKCISQFFGSVLFQNQCQSFVGGLQRFGLEAQQNNPRAKPVDEYQSAVVLVSRDHDATFLNGSGQKSGIIRSRESCFGSSQNVMSKLAEKPDCHHVNVLIREEFQAAVPKTTSSVCTTLMAY